MSNFSDNDLRDFLDGTLPEKKSAEILEALTHDPDLEVRLMALDDLSALVSDAFKDVGPAQSAEAFVPAKLPSPANSSKAPLLIAACVAALLMVGGAFALKNTENSVAPWMHQVAAYQALYSSATISDVAFTEDEVLAQLAKSEAALDVDLRATELSDVTGLELKRAQLLAFSDQPLSQIVFADAGGLPIALCVFEDTSAPSDGIAYAELEGMQSARFSVGGFSFLLIGPTDDAAIEDYASRIRDIFV